MLDEFVKASQPMKKRHDIEFMGYLLGTVEEETRAVNVTGLYIPEQTGERDKVQQSSENTNLALLGVTQEQNACVVGWVHSHPTFDAYLSSVDQHQQAHIQSGVNHAVAVVFDKDDDPSFFTLLPDVLAMLKKCAEAADGFHLHIMPNNDM